MTVAWTLTFDCADAPALASFWALALGYVDRPAPEGWQTWEDWLRHFEVPEDEWGDGAALADPEGRLPPLSFLAVSEGKTAKNRVHLDLQVSGGRHLDQAVRRERIEAHVARLEGAGATVLHRVSEAGALDHVVMADPEGNEFCVV